jgi:hypothetical protein
MTRRPPFETQDQIIVEVANAEATGHRAPTERIERLRGGDLR